MIVVDTSALVAVLLREQQFEACKTTLDREQRLLMSAGTLAEALIVATRRGFLQEMSGLVDAFGFEIATVTPAAARRVAEAYSRWGKGVHPAGLNFGDCFAYALARENDCALLFVGDDFAKTDVRRAA